MEVATPNDRKHLIQDLKNIYFSLKRNLSELPLIYTNMFPGCCNKLIGKNFQAEKH